MFSYKTLPLYIAVIKIASYGGLSPIVWFSDTKTVATTNVQWKWMFVYGCMVHLYTAHLTTVVLAELFFTRDPNISEISLAFGTLMIIACILIIYYNTLFQIDTIMYFINSFLYFYEDYRERYLRDKKAKFKTPLDILLIASIIGIFLFAFLFGTYFYENPNDKIFATSYFTDPTWIKIVFCTNIVPCIFITFGGAAALVFTLFTVLLPIFVAHAMGKEIMPIKRCNHTYATNNNMRNPPDIIILYKTLYLFNMEINEITGPIFFPLQNVLSYCIVICNVCLITFSELLDRNALIIISALGVVCLITWMGALWVAGMAFKISSNRIVALKKRENWILYRDQVERKYFKRALSALRPLQLRAGNFYRVRMVKAMKFFDFIIWATTKVLILISRYR